MHKKASLAEILHKIRINHPVSPDMKCNFTNDRYHIWKGCALGVDHPNAKFVGPVPKIPNTNLQYGITYLLSGPV